MPERSRRCRGLRGDSPQRHGGHKGIQEEGSGKSNGPINGLLARMPKLGSSSVRSSSISGNFTTETQRTQSRGEMTGRSCGNSPSIVAVASLLPQSLPPFPLRVLCVSVVNPSSRDLWRQLRALFSAFPLEIGQVSLQILTSIQC
jgi:hypothetical protein